MRWLPDNFIQTGIRWSIYRTFVCVILISTQFEEVSHRRPVQAVRILQDGLTEMGMVVLLTALAKVENSGRAVPITPSGPETEKVHYPGVSLSAH